MTVGGVIWPLLGGVLGGISWHLPFLIYFIAIPIGVGAALAIPDKRHRPPDLADDSPIDVMKDNPVLYIMFGLMLFTSLLLYVGIVFLPQLLNELGETRPLQIRYFIAAMSLAAAVTAFFFASIKSRLSYQRMVYIALILWSVSCIAISAISFIPLLIFAVIIFGIGIGLALPTFLQWSGEVGPVSCRGRICAYLGSFSFLGMFIAPLLFAPILARAGAGGVFLVSGLISAVLFFLVIISGKMKVSVD